MSEIKIKVMHTVWICISVRTIDFPIIKSPERRRKLQSLEYCECMKVIVFVYYTLHMFARKFCYIVV